MDYIGVDGAKAGWVVAVLEDDARRPRFYLVPNLRPVIDLAKRDAAWVAIDMPIGLPDGEKRTCDSAARKRLGPRASSVFSPPCRAALRHFDDYHAACAANERNLDLKISKQSHALFERMRHVDGLMMPDLQRRVREAHPEVTFAVLRGTPMEHHKREPQGRHERTLALARAGVLVESAYEQRWFGARVGEDDLLDAAACAQTARRMARGVAESLPGGEPQRDRRGLAMTITA